VWFVVHVADSDTLVLPWIGCAGDVVSEETYTKCIKPDGEFKGKRVGPKDIIRLQNGGTGFAARDGDKAEVKKHFALGEWREVCVVCAERGGATKEGGGGCRRETLVQRLVQCAVLFCAVCPSGWVLCRQACHR
jgi:hypothetical protein